MSETAPLWRRAVGPVAEWVTQAILNSSSDRNIEISPTPLTQRRRTEGRGKVFAARVVAGPRPANICEICGVEGIKKRYWRSCALEVAKETMTQVALIGHSKPKSTAVKARISKKLSNHAVANTWWTPADQPEWLTHEFYSQRIQPQLPQIKVRTIAEALHVSQAYAAQVRTDRRCPHPRHWQELSQLVGVLRDLQKADS